MTEPKAKLECTQLGYLLVATHCLLQSCPGTQLEDPGRIPPPIHILGAVKKQEETPISGAGGGMHNPPPKQRETQCCCQSISLSQTPFFLLELRR